MINMMIDRGDLVQAFPIHEKTIIGILTDENVKDYILLHADETTTVSIVFASGTIVVNMIQGEDITIGAGAETITTSGVVRIS